MLSLCRNSVRGVFGLARRLSTNITDYPKLIGNRVVPAPTPDVPDVAAFLRRIGRAAETEAARIPSWDALFSWDSARMARAGVPVRPRKYILQWAHRFRVGVAPYEIPACDRAKRRAARARRAPRTGQKTLLDALLPRKLSL